MIPSTVYLIHKQDTATMAQLCAHLVDAIHHISAVNK